MPKSRRRRPKKTRKYYGGDEDDSDSDDSLNIGTLPLVNEKYEIMPAPNGKKYLGIGANGTVYLVRNNADDKMYALKRVHLSSNSLDNLMYEVEILKKIKSDCHAQHFLCFAEEIHSNKEFYIVTEYLSGYMDYNHFMKVSTIENNMNIFSKLCATVKYLHDLNVVHRDIKPENVMVNLETLNIKLIDFGISYSSDLIGLPYEDRLFAGTHVYMDPILLKYYIFRNNVITEDIFEELKQSDLYSLGMILFEICSDGLIPAIYNYGLYRGPSKMTEYLRINLYFSNKVLTDLDGLGSQQKTHDFSKYSHGISKEGVKELPTIKSIIERNMMLNEPFIQSGQPYGNILNLMCCDFVPAIGKIGTRDYVPTLGKKCETNRFIENV